MIQFAVDAGIAARSFTINRFAVSACDLFDQRLSIELVVRRVSCERCGPKTEKIGWLPSQSWQTWRLIRHVEELCKDQPIKHVSQCPEPACPELVERVEGLSFVYIEPVPKSRILG